MIKIKEIIKKSKHDTEIPITKKITATKSAIKKSNRQAQIAK